MIQKNPYEYVDTRRRESNERHVKMSSLKVRDPSRDPGFITLESLELNDVSLERLARKRL